MAGNGLLPQKTPEYSDDNVVFMNEFILEKSRLITPHQIRILRAFREEEGVQALSEYEQGQVELLRAKLANITTRRTVNYLDERDELDYTPLYGNN